MQLTSLLRRLRSGAALNSLIVMGGYLLSRMTGLLRDMVVSAQFGTSPEYGAYVAAFRITDLLYIVIIGGALGSSFIPVFIQVWDRDGERRAWQLAGAVLTWAMIILVAASGLLFVLAPWLTGWAYGGGDYTPELLALTSDLTRLFLLSPLLLGLGGLAMAALNARERFTMPALAPAIYNIGIIGGAFVLAPTMGIWGLAWGVVIGALLYLLVQLPALHGIGMRVLPSFGGDIPELRTVATQMGPRVLGQSAAHISTIVTAGLAARLAGGPELIGGLNYAFQMMLLPYGIFSLSLSTVAYPTLARLYAEGRLDDLRERVRRTLGLILFLTIPAAAGLLVLALPLVRLLLERGAFDRTSTEQTALAMLGYALALPAFAASEILIRTFYAMQRTWVPVLIGVVQVILNLACGLLLWDVGIAGLALAFSIANNIESVLLLLWLPRVLPEVWRDRSLWRSIAVAFGAAALAGLALVELRQLSLGRWPFLAAEGAYQWQRDMLPLGGWIAGAGLIFLAIYAALTWLGGARELRRGRG